MHLGTAVPCSGTAIIMSRNIFAHFIEGTWKMRRFGFILKIAFFCQEVFVSLFSLMEHLIYDVISFHPLMALFSPSRRVYEPEAAISASNCGVPCATHCSTSPCSAGDRREFSWPCEKLRIYELKTHRTRSGINGCLDRAFRMSAVICVICG